VTTTIKPEPPAAGAGTAVARVEPPVQSSGLRLLRPIAAPAQMIEAQNAAREFIAAALKQDTDFGIIPGTKKPTMLKPGAEKVTAGFGLTVQSAIVERDIDHDRVVKWVKRKVSWEGPQGQRRQKETIVEGESIGLYRYVVRVDLVDQDGVIRGSGLGSCSTMESKYIDRPRDSENTTLKMAFKRAHVAAVLTTFGLSDAFTQDVEDLPHVAEHADVPPEAFVMPFGDSKGTPLGELETKDIAGALKWAKEKGKFDEFQVAAQALLDVRAKAAEAPQPTASAEKAPATTTDPVLDDTLKAIADALGSISDVDKRARAKAKWEKMRLEGVTESQAQDVLSRLLALDVDPPAVPAGGAA
jgi:hypothetical protein